MAIISLEYLTYSTGGEFEEIISINEQVSPVLKTLTRYYHEAYNMINKDPADETVKGIILDWNKKRDGHKWLGDLPAELESGMTIGIAVSNAGSWQDIDKKVIDHTITPKYMNGAVFTITKEGFAVQNIPVTTQKWNNYVPCKRRYRRGLEAQFVYVGTEGEGSLNPKHALGPYNQRFLHELQMKYATFELGCALGNELLAKRVKKHLNLDSLGCLVIAKLLAEDNLGDRESVELVLDELCTASDDMDCGHELPENYVEKLASIKRIDIKRILHE